MYNWSWKLTVWILTSLVWTAFVDGQETQAVCDVPSLSWSFNSLNQSPCLVAAYLSNPCSPDGDFDVPAGGPGLSYIPSVIPTLCECSTVTYSLFSACAACQSGAVINEWSQYIENCTQVSADGVYGFTIPPGTAVPDWAFQLVEETNIFNLTLAEEVGDKPEHTSHSKKSTPVGAIVGGVVGGVGGLALIGGLIAFILIRRKRNQKKMVVFDNATQGQEHKMLPQADSRPMTVSLASSPPPLTPSPGINGQMYSQPIMSVSPMVKNKVYDPEDPSTFPTWSSGEPTPTANAHNAIPFGSEYKYEEHGSGARVVV